MTAGEGKPTWVLLPESKLLNGARALSLLGCIVADVHNPTDDYAPEDISALRADPTLPPVQQVTATNSNTLLATASSAAANVRLSRILSASRTTSTEIAQSLSSTNIITRFLELHVDFFRRLLENETYKAEIERMYKSRTLTKKMDVAYMVVGVKTCLNARIENLTTLKSSVKAGMELPVGQLLQQLSGTPTQNYSGDNTAQDGATSVLDSLNVGTDAYRNVVSGLFTSCTATGEQVFAIQYREIKKHKDWLRGTESFEVQTLHSTTGPGIFGRHKEEEEGETSESDSIDEEDKDCSAESLKTDSGQAANGDSGKERMDADTSQLQREELAKALGQMEITKDKEIIEEAEALEQEAREVSKEETEQFSEELSREETVFGDKSSAGQIGDHEFELGSGLALGQIGELVVVRFI
jgi:hypothetical protein